MIQGKAIVQKDNQKFELNQNQSTYIDIHEVHRLSNKSDDILQIIEV